MRRTGLSPEPWPWVGRPRVLLEHPDESDGLALAGALREAGYAVAVCPGPERSERCPLTGPEGCAVARDADVVVAGLGVERRERREVLEALRARCPSTPLVVLVPSDRAPGWEALLDGCELIGSPTDPGELLAAVREALAEPGAAV